MRVYLNQYNFIVLFWFLRALHARRECSSGVSGHKIRFMKHSQIDTGRSKYIWKKLADAILYNRCSLCENIKKVGLYQLEVESTDVRILLKSI
jgi:hypothetical protein